MSGLHTHVEPVKVRFHSPELHCDVRRTVGYRLHLGDGTKGPTRATVREARSDRGE